MSRWLVGWSKIAGYLRVSPRTARRWREQWGLPVERITSSVARWRRQLGLPDERTIGRVQSTTHEIDNWMLALDQAHRELGVTGPVKLRADRFRIVELALDKLWDANRQGAA